MSASQYANANLRGDVVDALNAIDSPALAAVARETGISERTLWRYRGGGWIPEAKLRVLARALGVL